ncbi:MAG: TIGR02757 family protein [Thermodesulfovibrionia bacterium]|nr:TIGR02757 family protein [Thermodesulfovibrionia bacterium]
MTGDEYNSFFRSSLKNTLEKFYRDFDFQERLKHDPIEFPHRYSTPEDIEIAAFIASSFAYGKVGLFKPVIEKILQPGGKRPASFILNFNLKKDKKYLNGIKYRFSTEDDVLCYVYMLSNALKEWGSLKELFTNHYSPEHEDIKEALTAFAGYFLSLDTSKIYGENIKPLGVTHLFPSPDKGSACKRLNLFLRWMVRTKDIDFGIWDKVPASKLIIPLDTHIARISRCLGLTARAASDWKTAKEITESLKRFDPNDPIKYDFALCHHGISGLCKGKKHKGICSSCTLFST